MSGLAVEYQILEIYSRDAGQRSADISFNVGQGTQDIGFRNDMLVLFHADPARQIKIHVLDENGKPSIASLTIRDRWNRLYPNPSKRLAPDFFFQPQIYRADGESIDLPPGYYTVAATGGPEYNQHTKEFSVDAKGPEELELQAGSLDRSVEIRLVFRRSPCSRGRLFALPESGGRCAAERHDAADLLAKS